jgi:NAD(P)-dependent dehydrogenase (short-subunit alcohol dehydrogenase family)
MAGLEGQRVVVTGGSRGLGLGIVEALVERKARVTVLARDRARLAEVQKRLEISTVVGDVTDRAVAHGVIRDIKPDVLILNAGSVPNMAPIHEHTWESFSASWENDTKAGFFWIQEAIRFPLPRGSRVLIGSSGAAMNGSPLSASYAGAKRMLWIMANYANGVSSELGLGIRFQVLVPRQVVGATDLGQHVAQTYAKRRGITPEQFLANFGEPMTLRQYGEYVMEILTDSKHADTVAFGVKGGVGVFSLDAPAP